MTKVKICGITNIDDALVALDAGADLLGFIFYEPSPRYVRSELVREIVTQLKGAGGRSQESGKDDTHHLPRFIGVFVNEPLTTVQRTLDFCRLDAAQLHGDESPEFVASLAGRAYKALRPPAREAGEAMVQAYLPCSSAPLLPCLLLDAYHPTLYGGTGRVTDWSLAAVVAAQHDILLAGSLTPENVAEAVRTVRPWGVDVSSGVEAEKGRKDWGKVRAFVKNAKRKT